NIVEKILGPFLSPPFKDVDRSGLSSKGTRVKLDDPIDEGVISFHIPRNRVLDMERNVPNSLQISHELRTHNVLDLAPLYSVQSIIQNLPIESFTFCA